MDDPRKFDECTANPFGRASFTVDGGDMPRHPGDAAAGSYSGDYDRQTVRTARLYHFDRVSREDRDMREGMLLPADPGARKNIPLTSGVLDYFPLALAYVAKISKAGNDQHNPGQRLHWARGKSADHADCIPRHLIDRGTYDSDGLSHTGKLAWRSLALLQEELEREVSAGNDPFKTAEK